MGTVSKYYRFASSPGTPQGRNWKQPDLFTVLAEALSPPPQLQSSPTSLTDWQRFLALPVLVLAYCNAGFTGDHGTPCWKCGLYCDNQVNIRSKCLLLQAYQEGLSFRFGDVFEGNAAPTALAKEGGYRFLPV